MVANKDVAFFILQIQVFPYNRYVQTSSHNRSIIIILKNMPSDFTNFIATHQWIFILAALWTIPWKGVALWRAARNQSIAWFVVFLIINTLGVLEIIYIFFFSRKKFPPQNFEASGANDPSKIVLDIK
jgi:hypothetical protein